MAGSVVHPPGTVRRTLVAMGRFPPRSRLPHRRRRVVAAPALLAVLVLVALPAVASAHPLGNFTINHYAGLTIGRERSRSMS